MKFKPFKTMTLAKARIATRTDTLIYNSKTFSIGCEWDGRYRYTFNVFDEVKKELVEITTSDPRDTAHNTKDHFELAEQEFNRLKTKYIFDYEKKLNYGTTKK